MRRVEVSEYFTPERAKGAPAFPMPKTQIRPAYCGLFLGWGHMLEEGNEWGCAISAGLVEMEDGRVDLVYPPLIRFLDRDAPEKAADEDGCEVADPYQQTRYDQR